MTNVIYRNAKTTQLSFRLGGISAGRMSSSAASI